jgi:hypothetical protein
MSRYYDVNFALSPVPRTFGIGLRHRGTGDKQSAPHEVALIV